MTELKRWLGLGQATAIVVGTIIGASIFVQPSEIARLVPGVFAVWIVAGLLTLFGALCCAELASAFPARVACTVGPNPVRFADV